MSWIDWDIIGIIFVFIIIIGAFAYVSYGVSKNDHKVEVFCIKKGLEYRDNYRSWYCDKDIGNGTYYRYKIDLIEGQPKIIEEVVAHD